MGLMAIILLLYGYAALNEIPLGAHPQTPRISRIYVKYAPQNVLDCYKAFTDDKYMENVVDIETKNIRNKRKKFEDIAVRRVNRVIKEIRLIGNLSNRASYDYTDEDVKKITRALQREVDAVKARFEGPGKGADPVFSL
jgi:hypothetical protein